ncbi:prohibitin family protein [Deinococcus peraridilitoris]|uniref:Membrane protease subunit, stomatin/prohibitin n=1 Tax=Deinococcus peraridilitoris (strain DSM 19664 / LMG 22246 / CIP 109416 / KR-200) TaxID=937777 RepID=K9ZYK6_DEIPD|nr:prohibitin family protein [Deinococcus peraridilitoris]AFZ66733.1 membrane protease subunit, stomatin/prohibitin [Deinococcus peraridilitoris DSM 19664]
MFGEIGVLLAFIGVGLIIFSRVRQLPFTRTGWAVLGAGALIAAVGSALVVIPAGQAGVVFSALRGVRPTTLGEGIHFVTPAVDSVIPYDVRLQELTLSRIGEDGRGADESIQARSKEGLGITADVTVQFRVKREEAALLHKELGPNYITTVIRPQVRSKVRDGVGQFNAADLISTQRAALEGQITQSLREVFERNHLELVGVLLRELRIPESVAKAIEEKQTAEQQVAVERNRLQQANIAAQRKVVEARAESDAAIARAEGESRALSLRGKALKENPEIIQLTVAEKLSPGIQTVMLPSDGNFLMDVGSLTRARSSQP